MTKKMKTALLLTGAAARISQEVAIVDKLIENKGLEIRQDETLLTGFSSGSLNLAAINMCFRTNDSISWEDYYKREVLFKLKSKEVFTKKLPPFSTEPLRKTLNTFLAKGGFKWVEDLPFKSYVLTFSRSLFETLWVGNLDEKQMNINLSDLFMASTAIPVVFPAQEISCKKGESSDLPSGLFNDGGTGGTFKRFEEYIGSYAQENGPFERLFIVSPMREKSDEENDSLFDDVFRHKNKKSHLKEANLGNISFHTFMKFLVELHKFNSTNKIAEEIFVSIPDMEKNYPILNFDIQEEQYDAVCKWIEEKPDKLAIPLEKFIET